MPAETPEDRYSILLVEDDPGVADMLTTLLQERNYVVYTCKDGKDVLPLLGEQKFSLLILDVLLPHVSGFAVADQIRAQPHLRNLPLIMISGIYRSRNHRTHVMQAFKALDYLDKPVNPQRLLELCQKALGAPQRQITTRVNLQAQPPQEASNPTLRLNAPESLNDEEAKQEQQQVEDDARRKFRPSAFVSQGSIKSQPVPALLARLWHSRASGALLLRRGEVKKIVYMRQGSPYTVQSNLVSECLGQVLVHERLISRDECEQSIAWMRRSGRRQGEILVDELKCITLQNLQFGLEVQLETKLFSTFNWDTGAFASAPRRRCQTPPTPCTAARPGSLWRASAAASAKPSCARSCCPLWRPR